MDKHLRRIVIRRGLSSQRINVLYEEGEPVYLVDKKRIYIGDNETFGGNLATNINFVQNGKSLPSNSVQNDFILDKTETSGYLINGDNGLTKIFSICCASNIQDFINRVNNFFNGISAEYCSTDKGIITDTQILIDTDNDAFLRVDDKFCQLPVFNKKYLNFKENQIYTLDVFNPQKTQFINFKDSLPDGDSNVPPKNVFIRKSTIKTSANLELVDSNIGTITVKTNSLINGSSEKAWIQYGLGNSCGKTTTGEVSGFIDPINIRRFFFDFDYLLLSTEFYGGLDLNLYVNIINPKIQTNDVYYNNKNFSDILIHGGSVIGANTEYVLLDLKKFKETYSQTESFILDIKCIWNSKMSTNPINLNLDLYGGGYYIKNMSKSGFDFINYSKELHITEFKKIVPLYKTMTRYCTLNFDIKEYIGVLNNNDSVIYN